MTTVDSASDSNRPLRRLIGEGRCAQAQAVLGPVFAAGQMDITGQRVAIAINPAETTRVYAPLSVLALELGRRSERAMLAIAGPPGSGKSVLAALLTRAVQALDHDRHINPVAMGLDGFHYPNETLRSRRVAIAGHAPVQMELYKGAEFTYDVEAAKAKFREIKAGHGRTVAAPAYDRRLHEPVPDRVLVPPQCRLVVVEGNYLLLDQGDWRGTASIFDLSVYVNIAPRHCKPALIARHRRGGRGQADAEQHYERVDLRNTQVVEATRTRADLVLDKSADHRAGELWVQHPQRVHALI